jgi:hypothetical protein
MSPLFTTLNPFNFASPAPLPAAVTDVITAAADHVRETSPEPGGVLVHLDGDDGIWRESAEQRRERLKVCSPISLMIKFESR